MIAYCLLFSLIGFCLCLLIANLVYGVTANNRTYRLLVSDDCLHWQQVATGTYKDLFTWLVENQPKYYRIW